MLYRASPADSLLVAPLDAFTAVFHRASGITHLLTEPAPQILAVLHGEGLTFEALMSALAARYELADGDARTLSERLDELIAAGLVTIA